MPEPVFYRWQGADLLLHILVQPKAAKDQVIGPHGGELKVRITAPPVDGAANQGLIKFFSKVFKVPKSHIAIVSGESSRHKCIRVQSPKCLLDWIDAAK